MREAAAAGVDAVKFCKRDIASDLTAAARATPYCGPQSFGATYGEHREALELSPHDYRHLKDRIRYNGWHFLLFATACDRVSVDHLEESIDPELYKIASRDLDNLPLLQHVAKLRKPVILSAGMARPGDIERALDTVRAYHDQIVLMVCTSEYPTPNCHVGLRRIRQWRYRYGVLIGLSDHTPGITAGISGAALGACVVEKHLTLSRAMKGTDHAASLESDGMRRMVEKIREVEEMLRDVPRMELSDARRKLGRSLVSVRRIAAGETITERDLCLKSPGTGIPWRGRETVIGLRAVRDIPADSTIKPVDVEGFGEQFRVYWNRNITELVDVSP
jgi:sialic acid synthase SpsE